MPPAHHHVKKIGIKKAYKGESKNATKRSVGRVETDVPKVNTNPKILKLDNRAARVNHSKQLQKQNREDVILKKRLGGKNGSPKIVAIIPLSNAVDVNQIAIHLTKQCQLEQLIPDPLSYCTTMTANVEKKQARFTFTAVPRDPVAVADIAKVADVVYLVVAPQVNHCSDEEWSQMQQQSVIDKTQEPFVDKVLAIDPLGNHFIQLLKAQGLPTTIGVAQGISNQTSVNKQKWVNRLVQQYFHYVFDKDVSSFPLDNGEDQMQALLRATYNITTRSIVWREERTRMFTESVQFVKNNEYDVAQQAQSGVNKDLYDMTRGTLKVTGFLRGKHSISANQLVHLTGFGDFQVIAIDAYENAHIHVKSGTMPQKLRLLSNPEQRTSLEGLLATTEQEAMMHGSSIAFESSDNINMAEFNQTLQQNKGVTTNLATGAQAMGEEVLSNGGLYNAKTGRFLDWRSQTTSYIRSFSSLSSGTEVVQNDTPVFTDDVIKTQKRQDDKGIIQSVWDSIDLDGTIDTENNDGLTMNRFGRKIQLNEVMDASYLESSDEEDEMDDEALSYNAIRKAKKDLKKQQQESDGFSTTSSLLSSLSGFSMGSLRDPNLSPEQLKEKFNDLPYKEKLRRLMKYGQKGEDKLFKVRQRMEREEVSNPDEVDYHPDVTARARFVRYHPMKSYRHSVWDVNENLPAEYNNIVQFNNFDVSAKNARDRCALVDEDDIFDGDDDHDGEMMDDADIEAKHSQRLLELTLPDGARLIDRINPDRLHPITVYLSNVPEQLYESLASYKAYGLLWWLFNHERKVSVAHCLIRRHTEYTPPVRTKDPMHVQIGFRRFLSAPIFSEIDPHADDRALVKRFLPNDEKFYLSSMYSRITFPPSSVLMFSAHVLGSYKDEFPFNPLVASGRLVTFDPNKILLKRSVLSGYPETVSKYKVVIRHMFYNASDVKWFKPVELWTKRGHSGHIHDSRGLHGTYKATFDKTFKEKCSVHLSLYKRQFPIWNPLYLG